MLPGGGGPGSSATAGGGSVAGGGGTAGRLVKPVCVGGGGRATSCLALPRRLSCLPLMLCTTVLWMARRSPICTIW